MKEYLLLPKSLYDTLLKKNGNHGIPHHSEEKKNIPLQTLIPPPKLINAINQEKKKQPSFSPIPLLSTSTSSPSDIPPPPNQSNPSLRHLLSLKGVPNTRISYCLEFLSYLKQLPLIKWDHNGILEQPFQGINIVDFVKDVSQKSKTDIPKSTILQYADFINSSNIEIEYILNSKVKSAAEDYKEKQQPKGAGIIREVNMKKKRVASKHIQGSFRSSKVNNITRWRPYL